jgi:tetratricopeptide (TPR) repeat protein
MSALELAEAFIRAGELSDALETLDKQLADNPADDPARRLRADVLMRLPGKAQAALADFDRLTQVTAEDETQRSVVYQNMNDWARANAAMARAYALRPDDEWIIERYITTLERSDQMDAARKLVADQPWTWRWLQIAGDLARRAGELQSALAYYEAAIQHLDTRMDTLNDPIAANLKQVLMLKRDSLQV